MNYWVCVNVPSVHFFSLTVDWLQSWKLVFHWKLLHTSNIILLKWKLVSEKTVKMISFFFLSIGHKKKVLSPPKSYIFRGDKPGYKFSWFQVELNLTMYLKNTSLNFYPLRRNGPYLLSQNVTLSFKLCNFWIPQLKRRNLYKLLFQK